MATILQSLARWARDLQPADLPPSVVVRARLQHLSTAGAVRSVRHRPVAAALAGPGKTKGPAARVTGGTAPARDALRLHAGLAGWLSYDDVLFLGHTSPGAVCGAWSSAAGHSVDELITATVIANEIAGRLGASLLLGPGAEQGVAVVHAAASAAAVGWLDGLDADALAHAMALALGSPMVVPPHVLLGGGMARALATASPAVAGLDAVALAKAGVRGALDLLDARDGLLGALSWVPLRNAFTGLGKAWLTETLAFKLIPASIYHQVAVQGVAEILARHVKAADKRLRVDQVERIEIRTGAFGWALEQLMADHPGLDPASVPMSLRRSVGALVVGYELTPSSLDSAWLDAHRDEVAEIARRVEVIHDWGHTLALVEHLIEVASPLFAGLTLPELAAAGQAARRTFGLSLPRPGAAELVDVVRARPDRYLDRLRHASGDLADARLAEWQFLYGADIKLFTSRGGSWPEERTLPEGSPGWPWDKTVKGVLHKYSAGDSAADKRAQTLLNSAGSEEAAGWVTSLLG